MANRIIGATDTTNNVYATNTNLRSVVIVGAKTGTPTITIAPNTLFTIDGTSDAKAKFGDSTIVKMVKVLIANGVNNIKGVIIGTPAEGETEADMYSAALDVTMMDSSIKCILLDVNTSTVITELKTHLTTAETEDLFRYAVLSTNVGDQTGLISFAGSVASNRIFVPGPLLVENDGTAVDPLCVSAGLTACLITETVDPALPMNSVAINGIGKVNRKILESERAALATGGVTVLVNDGITPVINRLVTSETADITWQEGTTRFIADYVLESVMAVLKTNYKRTKNVERIMNSIKTDVKTVLENLEDLEIIENFDPTTLTIVKDPDDVYGVLVDYEFDVVTPLYTIKITQHMKL